LPRPRPRSPPSTTLFRSSALGLTVDARALSTGAADLFATVSSGFGRAMDAVNSAAEEEATPGLRLTGIWLQMEVISPDGETNIVDRKSTRLESSHVKTSY